jgi:hypothetical protein
VLQAVVDELLVDLVADEEKVVLLDQGDDAADLLGRVDRPRRVVRGAEEDGFGPRRDLGLDGLGGRQPETVLDPERQRDDRQAANEA